MVIPITGINKYTYICMYKKKQHGYKKLYTKKDKGIERAFAEDEDLVCVKNTCTYIHLYNKSKKIVRI